MDYSPWGHNESDRTEVTSQKKKGIMHFHLTNMVALIAGNDIYKLIESLMVAQTVKHLPAMQET